MIKKVIYIIVGIILIVLALIFGFGIVVYSLKEDDSSGFQGLFISAGMIALGIFCLVMGARTKVPAK